MVHEMKLRPEYFEYINNGTKRIELRLFDEKRELIKLGDTIKFLKEPKKTEELQVKVIGLLRYNNFKDLLNDFPIEVLSDKSMNKEQLLHVLEEFYTLEEQQKYGVLGIRIEK